MTKKELKCPCCGSPRSLSFRNIDWSEFVATQICCDHCQFYIRMGFPLDMPKETKRKYDGYLIKMWYDFPTSIKEKREIKND